MNRVFPHLYKIRIRAKDFKKRSRRGDDALKWSLYAGLLFLVLR